MPGLLRGVARTAVVAGTATAVSRNRVLPPAGCAVGKPGGRTGTAATTAVRAATPTPTTARRRRSGPAR